MPAKKTKKDTHGQEAPQTQVITASSVAPEVLLPWYKTTKAKISGLVILIVAFMTLIVWFIFFRPYVSTDDARVAATIIKVANRGASDLIEKVNVIEGSIVKQGEILVELDHRSAQAGYDRAKAKAQLAMLERNRMEVLAAQQGASQQQLDRARSDAATADAELRLAELMLEFTYLKSPVNGIVIQKLAEEGNILEGNQTAVTIADIDNAWVTANVEETSIASVKPGQKVIISLDERGYLTGKVFEVRKAAASTFSLIPSDNASGNFIKVVQRIPVKILLDPHPGQILRVGQSVEIRIKVL
jgi:membrane fusion protein (multidrug efflux system)